MPVNGVYNNPIYLSDVKPRQPKNELGKEDFLNLLMTQMRHQDPLNPMDNNQYIAQMAQLSTLEQMTNLSESYSKSQAFSLLGKVVSASTYDAQGKSILVTGMVKKVNISDGNILLTVNGSQISLSDISEVNEDSVRQDQLDTKEHNNR